MSMDLIKSFLLPSVWVFEEAEINRGSFEFYVIRCLGLPE